MTSFRGGKLREKIIELNSNIDRIPVGHSSPNQVLETLNEVKQSIAQVQFWISGLQGELREVYKFADPAFVELLRKYHFPIESYRKQAVVIIENFDVIESGMADRGNNDFFYELRQLPHIMNDIHDRDYIQELVEIFSKISIANRDNPKQGNSLTKQVYSLRDLQKVMEALYEVNR
ncbi:MAG TPA: hypothetical protein VJH88_03960 [Candidatus Nanoarchaeia archaeon]|nr:hypothetical protein [Candidatus Nanoarchaeia archaeon]